LFAGQERRLTLQFQQGGDFGEDDLGARGHAVR
jgi:hypothetical protein